MDGLNFARAALGQGLAMGWGDEAEAWLRSKVGDAIMTKPLKMFVINMLDTPQKTRGLQARLNLREVWYQVWL